MWYPKSDLLSNIYCLFELISKFLLGHVNPKMPFVAHSHEAAGHLICSHEATDSLIHSCCVAMGDLARIHEAAGSLARGHEAATDFACGQKQRCKLITLFFPPSPHQRNQQALPERGARCPDLHRRKTSPPPSTKVTKLENF